MLMAQDMTNHYIMARYQTLRSSTCTSMVGRSVMCLQDDTMNTLAA